MPVSHVSSRGGRYAFKKYTLNMCTNTAKTMRLADHECSERMSQPKGTRVMMNWTLS